MHILVDGITYEPVYFPFYKLRETDGYILFGLRYPSGFTEKVMVVNKANWLDELKVYSEFLIREYLLEDDEMLSPRAMRLKQDVRDLFRER